jgi:hypothetical protein
MQQIDDPKSFVDKGMVVINAKSALDHDTLWTASFLDLPRAMNALGAQLDQLTVRAGGDQPLAQALAMAVKMRHGAGRIVEAAP